MSDAFDFYPAAYDGDIRDLKRQYDQKYPDDIKIQIFQTESAYGSVRDRKERKHEHKAAHIVQDLIDDRQKALQDQQSDNNDRLRTERRNDVDHRRHNKYAGYIKPDILRKRAEPHHQERDHFDKAGNNEIAAGEQQLFQQDPLHSSASAALLKNSK